MDITSQEFKFAAHELIDALPENATWDDLMYRIYVRQCGAGRCQAQSRD